MSAGWIEDADAMPLDALRANLRHAMAGAGIAVYDAAAPPSPPRPPRPDEFVLPAARDACTLLALLLPTSGGGTEAFVASLAAVPHRPARDVARLERYGADVRPDHTAVGIDLVAATAAHDDDGRAFDVAARRAAVVAAHVARMREVLANVPDTQPARSSARRP
jgi:hypothetical protein